MIKPYIRVRHPVVVGQDPDRRGADIEVVVESAPVQYTYFVYNAFLNKWLPRVERIPNLIDLTPGKFWIRASLTPESRAWILGDLRRRYPGAHLVHPYWVLEHDPGFRVLNNTVSGNGVNTVTILISHVQFADPGNYTLTAQFYTKGTHWVRPGTIPSWRLAGPARSSTPPVALYGRDRIKVWLKENALTR